MARMTRKPNPSGLPAIFAIRGSITSKFEILTTMSDAHILRGVRLLILLLDIRFVKRIEALRLKD